MATLSTAHITFDDSNHKKGHNLQQIRKDTWWNEKLKNILEMIIKREVEHSDTKDIGVVPEEVLMSEW